MKWQLVEPTLGDIIRVKAGTIYHYGIFVSDDEIIQFGLSPILRQGVDESDVEVCVSSIDEFLCGGFLEVGKSEKKDKKRLSPKKTVEIARSKLGQKGYSLIYNNCEHFANECYFGERYSSQTDGVRALFKKMLIVDVYVAEIPSDKKLGKLQTKLRQKEIDSVNNEKVKKEKYYAWKLLEYAIYQSFGKKINEVNFKKETFGKWTCDECEFSLSHSNGAVSVVVSKTAVGIDIEKIEPTKVDISSKILSKSELLEYEKLNDEDKLQYIIFAWTKKESLFKSKNIKTITIEEFADLDGNVHQEIVRVKGDFYALSIATSMTDKIRIYEGIDLV